MSLSRIALGVLGGIALSASSAMAADLAAYVPPPADWTGFYVGGGVCYDWANFDVDQKGQKKVVRYDKEKVEKKKWEWVYKNGHKKLVEKTYYDYKWVKTVSYVDFEKVFEGAAQAPCGTVTVGYDWQIDPHFVVGAFASYDWQNKKGDLFKTYHDNSYDVGDVWLGNIATVGGRAGMLVTPKVLVYALFGWSWTKGGYSLYGNSYASNLSGPTIGAGVEAVLYKRLSGRVEYRFTDFGKFANSGGDNCLSYTNTAKITDQSVRLVLSYKL